jgi:hypothetical protein
VESEAYEQHHNYLILDAIVMAEIRLFTVGLQLNALRAEKHCC